MAPGPIDIRPSAHSAVPIAANRPNSGGITSNLTSALRAAGEAGRQSNFSPSQPSNFTSAGPQFERGSISQGINIGGIASAVNHSGKFQRRESQTGAGGSLVNGGMSWGGVSVGSWIRDDIIMTGTSPFSYQSPSYHSSSYLPKLEANFFRDFSCCGKTLPSLHDLLQHYEEVHASQTGGHVQLPENVREFTRNNSTASVNLAGSMSAGLSRLVQQQQLHHQKMAQQSQGQISIRNDRLGSMSAASGGGVDVAEEMEMDDDDMTPPPNMNQMIPQQAGLRLSTQMPPNLMNNPTVSSVNTPNMPNPSTPATDRYRSPDSSGPGTPGPADIKNELENLSNFGAMNLNYMENELDMTINDPGKHLFNPMGNMAPRAPGFPQMSLQQLRAARENELARRMNLEGYMGNNVPGASIPGNEALLQSLWAMQEDKPYKCPVIGCEKAYKNQNGLKYHKNHGHVNQTLHQNPDGTYSIINPETSIPYPGTMGMEKEKPYKCEFCGKRYKNLNGLKYHRAHSNHQFAAGLMMAGMGGGMPPLDDAIGEDY
ncbi:Transcriptional regulator of ribosomal bioproteinsis proteins [Orbilia oligospora]|uniref:Transcriptional regulator of ribosomal bioproteinsis proteins n=1 Tax=Orbilia oligospora TaxID=2813651 RepID=A0A7C8N4J1_ORBOL|nr:Transcriptional regulator of ribosomal bioproteinsis proteins [Orbilia oligospora]KAF3112645.1 Transcriptional regulator of ribosomal bioproteinsis proteins [Orbilia oligospora]KAF3123917.1 Transcriptional regulator of ribosomal bioproteinsis proteins [Orbilia oligospora]